MGNIIKIFLNDIKTISRNVIVFIVIIGISVLPALYSWFNIASNWDPYSSTGGIAFAVCSKDKGYTYKALTINAGEQITDSLKANDKMGWDFVDEQTALDGVDNGTYYAAVIIPENFSENLCSVITGEFEKANLDYYVNEKKNPIAPKMTNSGMTTITNEVKSAYVNTLTTVIATTLNITTDELNGNKDEITGKVKDSLNEVVEEIDSFETSVDVFGSTLDMLKQLINTNKELLPSISETLSKSGVITSDVKSSIEATRLASANISDSLWGILSSAENMQETVSQKADSTFEKLESDASSAADELINITEICSKIISVNNTIISTLENIQSTFEIEELSNVIQKFHNANERQQILIDKLFEAADTLTSTGTLPKEIQNEIKQLSAYCRSDITQLESSFSAVKESINKSADNVYNTLESASGLLQLVNGDIPEVEKALDSGVTTIDELKSTFESVKKLMDNSKKKTNNIIDKVDELSGNNTIYEFVTAIINDPEALGEFVADPVESQTHTVHAVENYGSAMAPFYTSLGIWVGGIVLAAVVRTDLTKKQLGSLKKPTSTQLFIGRYLLFFVLGQIQSLIIALGDLFFLGIQCENIPLFIFTSLVSGFVYTMIIYSLTITFSVIGKALAVIILVIQVAGSGGTFPVEVLPQTFQKFVPYLPFKYGNAAFRETIAGVDYTSFWNNILLLLAFVPFALLLGLFLRKPCIKIISFFDHRLHQSELII